MSRSHRAGHNQPIEETLAMIAQQGVETILNALANYWTMYHAVPANTGAAPVGTVVAAIVLTPRESGIFRIEASFNFTDSVSEPVTVGLFAAEQAVAGTPITLVGGNPQGFGGNGVVTPTSQGETSAVAGGITVVGGSAAATLDSKTVQATATDPAQTAVSGLFGRNTAGKNPFFLGETMVVFIAVTAAAGVLSALETTFSVQEQPSA